MNKASRRLRLLGKGGPMTHLIPCLPTTLLLPPTHCYHLHTAQRGTGGVGTKQLFGHCTQTSQENPLKSLTWEGKEGLGEGGRKIECRRVIRKAQRERPGNFPL